LSGFNRAWLEFTGRTTDQEIGDGWREGVHEDDAERCHATYTEAVAARCPFEMEYRLRHHSGRYRTIADHGAPRFDGNGVFSVLPAPAGISPSGARRKKRFVERERVLRAFTTIRTLPSLPLR